MTYFSIQYEYSPKIIGVKELCQTRLLVEEYDYDTQDSIRNYWRQRPIIKPQLNTFLLEKKAIITDLVSSTQGHSHFGLLLSNKFINFLNQYSRQEAFIIPIQFAYKENKANYTGGHSLFILKNSILNYFNFKKSKFKIVSILEKYHKNIEIKSVESLEYFFKPNEAMLWHHKIMFDFIEFSSDMKFDIFRLDQLGGYYVSSRLKEAIEREGFTGMRFEEAKNIVVDKA